MRCVTAPECFGAITSFAKTSAALRKQETSVLFFLHKPGSEFQGQTVRICMNTIKNSVSGIPNGRVYLLVMEN